MVRLEQVWEVELWGYGFGRVKKRIKVDSLTLGLSHRTDGPAASWGRKEPEGAHSG